MYKVHLGGGGEGGGAGGAAPLGPFCLSLEIELLIFIIDVGKCMTKCMSSESAHMYWDKSLNESLHSNPSTFSIPHVSNFFQITIGEFFGRFNDNFH